MSLGKMRSMINIYGTVSQKDAEGFVTKEDQLLLSTRAYKEDRHGSETWKNRASFTTATVLFQFRKPPFLEITTEQIIVCKNVRYNIISVEDIRERGMFVEVLAETITGSKG